MGFARHPLVQQTLSKHTGREVHMAGRKFLVQALYHVDPLTLHQPPAFETPAAGPPALAYSWPPGPPPPLRLPPGPGAELPLPEPQAGSAYEAL
eukprot:2103521-Alexandrium_andersonii.AAC.1